MFTIFTESPSEKDILQQDFTTLNDRFHLNLAEAPAISGILRSISYELFQAAPPPIAQQVTKMAVDSLQLKLSLALYRQVLARIRNTERLLTLYRQYFLSLSRLVDSTHTLDAPSPFIVGLDEETSAICSLQFLDACPQNDLLITDFQDQLQRAVGKPCPPSPMQKTRKTAEADIQEEFTIRKTLKINLLEQSQFREKLDLTSKQVMSRWENEEWWRVREESDNSSRQISRFEGRRHENLLQASITSLMAEQAEFQRKREEELGKQKKKSEESIVAKFHKRMRENIIHAKLRRRRR